MNLTVDLSDVPEADRAAVLQASAIAVARWTIVGQSLRWLAVCGFLSVAWASCALAG